MGHGLRSLVLLVNSHQPVHPYCLIMDSLFQSDQSGGQITYHYYSVLRWELIPPKLPQIGKNI